MFQLHLFILLLLAIVKRPATGMESETFDTPESMETPPTLDLLETMERLKLTAQPGLYAELLLQPYGGPKDKLGFPACRYLFQLNETLLSAVIMLQGYRKRLSPKQQLPDLLYKAVAIKCLCVFKAIFLLIAAQFHQPKNQLAVSVELSLFSDEDNISAFVHGIAPPTLTTLLHQLPYELGTLTNTATFLTLDTLLADLHFLLISHVSKYYGAPRPIFRDAAKQSMVGTTFLRHNLLNLHVPLLAGITALHDELPRLLTLLTKYGDPTALSRVLPTMQDLVKAASLLRLYLHDELLWNDAKTSHLSNPVGPAVSPAFFDSCIKSDLLAFYRPHIQIAMAYGRQGCFLLASMMLLDIADVYIRALQQLRLFSSFQQGQLLPIAVKLFGASYMSEVDFLLRKTSNAAFISHILACQTGLKDLQHLMPLFSVVSVDRHYRLVKTARHLAWPILARLFRFFASHFEQPCAPHLAILQDVHNFKAARRGPHVVQPWLSSCNQPDLLQLHVSWTSVLALLGSKQQRLIMDTLYRMARQSGVFVVPLLPISSTDVWALYVGLPQPKEKSKPAIPRTTEPSNHQEPHQSSSGLLQERLALRKLVSRCPLLQSSKANLSLLPLSDSPSGLNSDASLASEASVDPEIHETLTENANHEALAAPEPSAVAPGLQLLPLDKADESQGSSTFTSYEDMVTYYDILLDAKDKLLGRLQKDIALAQRELLEAKRLLKTDNAQLTRLHNVVLDLKHDFDATMTNVNLHDVTIADLHRKIAVQKLFLAQFRTT